MAGGGMKNNIPYVIDDVNPTLDQPYDFPRNALCFHKPKAHCL